MQHAFFVVGAETLFLVHMTNMWMEEHRYQCILRIGVDDGTKRELAALRKTYPDDWFIVGNHADSKFLIAQLNSGAVKSFSAGIWRGWFKVFGDHHWPWSKTDPVIEKIHVTVEQVVWYRPFDFNLERPRTLTYYLFGKGSEAHLQNYQVKQPDFDHVVTLKAAPSWLPAETLEAGTHVNFLNIPAVPGGSIEPVPGPVIPRRYDVHVSDPLRPGPHHVQYCGNGPPRELYVERTVFFGTFPVNNPDPAKPFSHPIPKGAAGDRK
jgi:hypothetical protein